MTQATPPEGFSVWPTKSEFVRSFVATMYFKRRDPHLIFRLQVQAVHCNSGGFAHGGFLSTLADIWLANNIAAQLPDSARFVTSNLSVDFLKPAHRGVWLESAIDRVKIGTRLCYASGAILTDGQPVAAMHGTFALLGNSTS